MTDDIAVAFDDFVERRYAAMLRFGYVLTGNRSSAEDLVQTALFRTYKRWPRLDDQVDPVAYVRRAMVNSHISWTRSRASREQLFADPPDMGAAEDGRDVERLQMWRDLATLPARMRAVLVLRYYEDLSEAETARVLGCSVGTVKSQASRGLARLRGVVDQPNEAADPEPSPLTAAPTVTAGPARRRVVSEDER